MKLLSFGEIIWDLYPDCKTIGGAPLNFTAVSALLGTDTFLWSAVGNDDLGRVAFEKLQSYGVNTKYICTVQGKDTGTCTVTLSDKGVPVYKIAEDSAYDYITDIDVKEKFDVLYFGTLALRYDNNISALKSVLTSGKFLEIFCDLNIRKPFVYQKTIEFCLNNATILKISQEELSDAVSYAIGEQQCYENTAKELSVKFPQLKLIIITKGENGSTCYDCITQKFYFCDAVKTEVVSTVGAGDSFSAAFLVKYLDGFSVQECLAFASRISAYVCSIKEAIPDNLNDA